MLEIFSTREIAATVWLIAFICFIFAYPITRKSAHQVIKSACSKQLVIPFIIMLIYAVALVFLFTLLPIWKLAYLKDIIIWVLFAGVPVCFGVVSKNRDVSYFKDILFDNLKFAVLVEFFISSFTFSFIIELLMLTVLTFLFLLNSLAETKDEYKSVKKFISGLLSIMGFVILGFTLRNAINAYADVGIIELLVSFFIPIVFSILYIPVAYGFAVYAKYQMTFIRMGFKESKDKKIKINHRRQIIKVCKLSYRKISLFEKDYVYHLYESMDKKEFDSLIDKFKVVKK